MVLVQNIKTNMEHGDQQCLFYVPVCFSSNVIECYNFLIAKLTYIFFAVTAIFCLINTL
jgi:hypothetical protein